eukprot:gene28516-31674_t
MPKDCVEDPMEVDRPVKTARTSSNSVHMAGGAPSGGHPNQGGRPAHPSPSGRGGRSPYGRGTHGRGSGGRHSGGRGDSSAPVFEGAPGDPCRLNSSISVAQANWLKEAQLAAVAELLGGDMSSTYAVCSSLNVGELGATPAVVAWTVQQLNSLRSTQDELIWGTNNFFVMVNVALVFNMQIGFAMFVAGVVRAMNMSSILVT